MGSAKTTKNEMPVINTRYTVHISKATVLCVANTDLDNHAIMHDVSSLKTSIVFFQQRSKKIG